MNPNTYGPDKGIERKKIRRRRDAARQQMIRMVMDLYATGKHQSEVAEELNIGVNTVARYIKMGQAPWLEKNLQITDRIKTEQLVKIDALERKYFSEWERSRLDAEVKTLRAIKDSGTPGQAEAGMPDKIEKTTRTEGQCGDPRYLEGVERCIQARCKILGIYAAEKREHSGEIKGGLSIDFSTATPEELTTIRKYAFGKRANADPNLDG